MSSESAFYTKDRLSYTCSCNRRNTPFALEFESFPPRGHRERRDRAREIFSLGVPHADLVFLFGVYFDWQSVSIYAKREKHLKALHSCRSCNHVDLSVVRSSTNVPRPSRRIRRRCVDYKELFVRSWIKGTESDSFPIIHQTRFE